MPMICVCQQCDSPFTVKRVSKYKPRFCSPTCMGTAKRKPDITRACAQCGTPFVVRKKNNEAEKRLFCSIKCHWRAVGAAKIEQSLAQFWDKVARCAHGEDCPYCCWPWLGATNKGGYGKLSWNGKDHLAHRRAWEIHQGCSVPEGWEVLPWCENRLCCNPFHLRAGQFHEPRRPSVTLICPQCHQPFQCAPHRIQEGRTNYCSHACRGASQRVDYTPEEKRAKQAAYQRAYQAQFTIEERRQRWRDGYWNNHAARLASIALYRSTNLEKVRAIQRTSKKKWGPGHRDVIRGRNQRYYALNSVRLRTRTAAYQRNNPAKVVAFQQRRRARKAAAPVNDLTVEQWEEIKAAYGYRCVYCPLDCKECKRRTHELTQDHLTSFYHNGSHTVPNVVPACQSCNSKKRTGPVLVPVQPLLLTIARPRPARKHQKKGDVYY